MGDALNCMTTHWQVMRCFEVWKDISHSTRDTRRRASISIAREDERKLKAELYKQTGRREGNTREVLQTASTTVADLSGSLEERPENGLSIGAPRPQSVRKVLSREPRRSEAFSETMESLLSPDSRGTGNGGTVLHLFS